tara:strand:+ start:562 stop:969 length:408 start_codon:yes stop_codon:yes gene_type:complete
MVIKIPNNKYDLILGSSSEDLFNYYNVDFIHGLHLKDCKSYKETNKDAFISGMSNESPNKTISNKPYVFINLKRLNKTFKDYLLFFHEFMHLSFRIHNWNISKEEQIITWAELETIKTIKKLDMCPYCDGYCSGC